MSEDESQEEQVQTAVEPAFEEELNDVETIDTKIDQLNSVLTYYVNLYKENPQQQLYKDIIKFFRRLIQVSGTDDTNSFNQRKLTFYSLIKEDYICCICQTEILLDEPIYMCSSCKGIIHLECMKMSYSYNRNCPLCKCSTTKDPNKCTGCFCGYYDIAESSIKQPHTCFHLCGRTLSCGHYCQSFCHPGACLCHSRTQYYCYCGRTCAFYSCTSLTNDTKLSQIKAYLSSICPYLKTIKCNCGRTKKSVKCSAFSCCCDQECGATVHYVLNVFTNELKPHYCHKTCHAGNHECTYQVPIKCYTGHQFIGTVPCSVYIDFFITRDHTILIEYMKSIGQSSFCDNICDRLLPCGNHRCKDPCHYGECRSCIDQYYSNQTCYCGKKNLLELPENKNSCVSCLLRTCGSVCDRLLPCGHRCTSHCHSGACPPCTALVSSICDCGATTLQCECYNHLRLKCHQECNTILSCGRHSCNTICCPYRNILSSEGSDIHQCKLPCNRLLSCLQHTCSLLCHAQECPPCQALLTDSYHCSCGYIQLNEPYLCSDYPLYKKYIHLCTKKTCSHSEIPSSILTTINESLYELCHHYPSVYHYLSMTHPSCPHVMIPEYYPYYENVDESFEDQLALFLKKQREFYPQYNLHLCHEGACPSCSCLVTATCQNHIHPDFSVCCHDFIKNSVCHQKCGKELDCHHLCQRECHLGPCVDDDKYICPQICQEIRSDCHHPCHHLCHYKKSCTDFPCNQSTEKCCPCGCRKEMIPCYEKERDIHCNGVCDTYSTYPYLYVLTNQTGTMTNLINSSLKQYHVSSNLFLHMFVYPTFFATLESHLESLSASKLTILLPSFIPISIIYDYLSHYSLFTIHHDSTSSIEITVQDQVEPLKYKVQQILTDMCSVISTTCLFPQQKNIQLYSTTVAMLLIQLNPTIEISSLLEAITKKYLLSIKKKQSLTDTICYIEFKENASIEDIINYVNQQYRSYYYCVDWRIPQYTYSQLWNRSTFFMNKYHYDLETSIYLTPLGTENTSTLSPEITQSDPINTAEELKRKKRERFEMYRKRQQEKKKT